MRNPTARGAGRRGLVRAALSCIVVGAVVVAGAGCSTSKLGAPASEFSPGDCVRMSGTPEQPEATKVDCGSAESSYKVAATVEDREQCPSDVDTYYSLRSSVSDAATTLCLDIDWVVGGCMIIDPVSGRDPARVDCDDASAPNRERVVEILEDTADAGECAGGLGYPYPERNFTVCVEDVR